jgi:hypothetical protein
MAVPLFVASTEILKSKLRLDGVSATQDSAQPLIEEAILDTRHEFYLSLGSGRITELLAIAFSESPTTGDEYSRVLANTLEVKMVRVRLMRTMPMIFMDGSGELPQIWQDEGAFREASSFDLRAEMDRLQEEIAIDLSILVGDATDSGANRSLVIEPEVAPPGPFDTVRTSLWP